MIDKEFLEKEIVQKLKSVFDPEIPVDIYELGLIYEVLISEESNVNIKMTLTSPACPVAGSLPQEVKEKVSSVKDVKDVNVELVWEPTWNQDMMSDEAKVELGFF